MKQPSKQPAVSAERCLGCEENETWVYSYEKQHTRSGKEHQLAIPSHPDMASKTSASGIKHPKPEYHNLQVGEHHIEVMVHGPLFELKILNRENEPRIILWGIEPAEAIILLTLLTSKLLKT